MCHNNHTLVFVSLVNDSYCCCKRTTCQALAGADRRDAEGNRFNPIPEDVSMIEERPDLKSVIKILSEQIHYLWVEDNLAKGWQFGLKRDDNMMTNPSIIPWSDLNSDQQNVYIENIKTCLKVIVKLGYLKNN